MSVYTYNRFEVPFGRGGAEASGVNDANDIVGSFPTSVTSAGFLESGGTYTIIAPPSAVVSSAASGINNLGQIVGFYQDASYAPHGFLYSNGTFTTLDDPLAAPGSIFAPGGTFASSINDMGQIVGHYHDGSATPNAVHGFLYDSNTGTYTTLADPLAIMETQAFGINNLGQIVGSYSDSTGTHGFLLSGGVYTTLDDPLAASGFSTSGAGTQAFGINDLGQIVGAYYSYAYDPVYHRYNSVTHSFLYSGGVFNPIDDPLALSSISAHAFGGTFAHDINNNGQIVGTVSDFSTGRQGFLLTITPNSPPAAGASANMVLRGANASPAVAGQYEIYNIGNNAMLAAFQLGPVGVDWGFVTLGGFYDGDTSDMLLRNSNTGGFEVYNIVNNNIINAVFLGAAGLDWQVSGFGNFSSLGENDMILRNTGTGGLQVYDIKDHQITGSVSLGAVGLNWQTAGVSKHSTQSDLVLRDSGSGGLEIYNINNNAITGAAFLGAVGLDWQVSGFGDFSSRNEGDMLLRNVNTGGLLLYDIANNAITGAFFLGNVGLDWEYAGIAPVHGPGTSDLVLRNVNSGAFQVYDIAGDTLVGSASLGAAGLNWQLGGFAADGATAPGAFADASNAQLVQAMAGFAGGTGAADGLNAGFVNADTSQQPLLTTPQHA